MRDINVSRPDTPAAPSKVITMATRPGDAYEQSCGVTPASRSFIYNLETAEYEEVMKFTSSCQTSD